MEWAFLDDDGDGLSNVLEIGWDTHPEKADTDGDGCTDGYEVAHRSDPQDPTSCAHVVYLPSVPLSYIPPALPILIDGDGQDWQEYAPVATDPRGDTTGGPHTDLKAVYRETDSHYLYIMAEVYDPPLYPEATLELNMEVTDEQGKQWGLHSNLQSDGAYYFWTDNDEDGELEPYRIAGIQYAWGDVMELMIPLAQLQDAVQVDVTLVNLWREIDGQWTWVDIFFP
jgi:hypothetical protein